LLNAVHIIGLDHALKVKRRQRIHQLMLFVLFFPPAFVAGIYL
jgi:hypothetical protein